MKLTEQICRDKIHNQYIYSDQHPENGLVNFITGKIIVNPAINAEESSATVQKQEAILPHWHYNETWEG